MTTEFSTHQRLSLLIHGSSKVGKSTLSATAPKPILVLDAEGSWRFIPLRQVTWDPTTGHGPPTYDGLWDACVVNVRNWESIERTFDWLRRWQTPFVSIVVDSITEIQRRLREKLVGTDAMKISDWGVLLARMDAVIRGFRDLALEPNVDVRCVVFVAETRQRQSDGKWIPYMQGQISVALPYWVDVCGALLPTTVPDQNGQPTREARVLWIGNNATYEAGERVQGRLGAQQLVEPCVDGHVCDDVTRWMRTVFGLTAPPASVASPTTDERIQ